MRQLGQGSLQISTGSQEQRLERTGAQGLWASGVAEQGGSGRGGAARFGSVALQAAASFVRREVPVQKHTAHTAVTGISSAAGRL